MTKDLLRHLWSHIVLKLNGKVDKQDGKGLSSNDYTDTEKSKLSSIEDNANNYVHPDTHSADMITGLANVAKSGDYNDLTNKPTIPTIPTSLPANGGDADTVDGKHATDFADVSHTHSQEDITGLSDSLNNKADSNHTHDTATTTSDGFLSSADKSKLNGIQDNANNYTHPSSHPASMITDLATIATSGSYDDLTNKPTIPTVGNGTITVKQNGVSKGTFTTNQSGNTTIELTDNNIEYTFTTGDSNGEIKVTPNDGTTAQNVPVKGLADAAYKEVVTSIDNSDKLPTSAAVQSAINSAISGVAEFDVQVVTELPTTGVKGVIYLVLHQHSTGDTYDEYIWNTSSETPAFEKIGNTDIDLSNYITKVTDATGEVPKLKSDGSLESTGFTLGTNVPSNAKFTDTVYTHPTSHPASMITGLANVATSGSYNDLSDKPTIPTIPSSLPADGGNADTVDNKHASDFAMATHTHSEYINQNAFSNVKVGSTTVASDTTTDTLTLVAGDNITITPDATNDKITISSTDTNTTYSSGTGLSLSGTTFNHSNSVTAGTAKGDDNKTLTFGSTFTIPSITYDAQGHITGKSTTTMTMPANPNTDTHYTTHLKVGASSSATANAAATNGNVYMNVLDNTTVRDSHNIVGSGATTVTSDANGKITINSTDTILKWGSF